jgi:hypothetical protein
LGERERERIKRPAGTFVAELMEEASVAPADGGCGLAFQLGIIHQFRSCFLILSGTLNIQIIRVL